MSNLPLGKNYFCSKLLKFAWKCLISYSRFQFESSEKAWGAGCQGASRSPGGRTRLLPGLSFPVASGFAAALLGAGSALGATWCGAAGPSEVLRWSGPEPSLGPGGLMCGSGEELVLTLLLLPRLIFCAVLSPGWLWLKTISSRPWYV